MLDCFRFTRFENLKITRRWVETLGGPYDLCDPYHRRHGAISKFTFRNTRALYEDRRPRPADSCASKLKLPMDVQMAASSLSRIDGIVSESHTYYATMWVERVGFREHSSAV